MAGGAGGAGGETLVLSRAGYTKSPQWIILLHNLVIILGLFFLIVCMYIWGEGKPEHSHLPHPVYYEA